MTLPHALARSRRISPKLRQHFRSRACSVALLCVFAFGAEVRADTAVKLDDSKFEDVESRSCLANWAANEWRLLPHDGQCRPKTLLAWSTMERTYVNGTEDEPLQSDRPDFTEASTTVGLRRLQIEMGYTYIRDNSAAAETSAHSFPETLYRIGLFAEWFEARIGWNYGTNLTRENIVSSVFDGGEDLYVGAKLALTEQDGWRPEMAVILQTNLPTGHTDLTSGEVEPGMNWLYGWDVTEVVAIGGSTQVNRAQDEADVDDDQLCTGGQTRRLYRVVCFLSSGLGHGSSSALHPSRRWAQ